MGPRVADALSGGSAGANTAIVASLPEAQKAVATQAYTDSLRTMWILYVCISAFGLLVSAAIGKQALSKTHEVTRTGLEEQERERRERKSGDAARRAEREREKGGGKEEV